MNQLCLVLPMPRARARDPETSHQAAARASSTAPNHRNIIMAALTAPATIKELAARSGLDHVQIARRMPELQELGLAVPTRERRDGCRVWERGPKA